MKTKQLDAVAEAPQSELLPVIAETGVNNMTQELLIQRFEPFLQQAKEWREKAFALVVTDISQTDEMKMAREGRLAIRRVRLDADATRKELKEDSNRYNKAVQGVYNMIESVCAPIEEHLERQEKFKELYDAKIKADLRAKREQECISFREHMFANIDLSDLTEEDYQRMKKVAQAEKVQAEEDAKIKAAEAEEKRKADEAERERLRKENDRLKKEAEERELLIAKRGKELQPYIALIRDYNRMVNLPEDEYTTELSDIKIGAEQHLEEERKRELKEKQERDQREMDQRKANIEAANARKAAEKKAEEERKERERLQKELDDKKAAEQKAEADKQAAIEAELAKGDAEKFNDLLEKLKGIKQSYEFKSKKHKAVYSSVCELIDKTINYAISKI